MMKPYIPDTLPPTKLDYQGLFKLMGEANTALAGYDSLLHSTSNPSVMLSPLVRQEAVLSSRIEGAQATIDEVLEHEAGFEKGGEAGKDIQEIVNYRFALLRTRDYLQDHPIALTFIRELHTILMDGIRRQTLSSGKFRQDQNWIGAKNCSIKKATFVPPSPLILPEHLDKWQRYLENDNEEVLLQTAIVHAQFELIHPFKEGNGHVGRILIPLFLYQKRKLSAPTFYLSEYLEAHRDEYYDRLHAISTQHDWNGWIAFFLTGIKGQAEKNSQTIKDIIKLYEKTKEKIQAITHSQYTTCLLDKIFSTPVFKVSELKKECVDEHQMNPVTTYQLLKRMKAAGILTELYPGKGRRSTVMAFPALRDRCRQCRCAFYQAQYCDGVLSSTQANEMSPVMQGTTPKGHSQVITAR